MRLKIILPCLLVILVPAARGADHTHDITPEDYFTLASITDIALSPDAKQVAYCLSTWDKSDDTRKTDLWIVATDGRSKPARLTFDRANDKQPRWSADGKTIYFLGGRKREAEKKPPFDGSVQVWRIGADGSDLRAVTRIEGGVSGFDFAAKAEALYFSHTVDATDDDAFSRLRAQFGKIDYGHGRRKVSEIHRLDLHTWRSEKLVDAKRYVREFTVTRDGKRIAMVTAFDDTVVKSEGESRVDIWDAETKQVTTPPTDVYRRKAASPWAWLESLAWSPDGGKFAFCAIFDAYPAEIVIGTKTADGWKTELAKRASNVHVAGYGSPLRWANDRLYFLREERGQVSVMPVGWEDSSPFKEPFERVASAFDVDSLGLEIAMVASTSREFAELHFGRLGPGPSRIKLTNLNPQTATWKLPTIQHITWKAPDGTEVGGVLELPHGHRNGDKLPLVVAIHGGPTMATHADLGFDPHNGRLYFAAKGFAVLLPNYRGSTGYGDKFVTDLIGNENDIDVKDILSGIQHLVRAGIVDPERVGVMGWSNGGYLTNCLITLKDPPVKFRAASSGAGILDTVAEWGFNDEPAYPTVFKKGLPWEQPEIYRKTSPTYGLGHVTTPTLIHVGANDERCPPGHSRMLYRALKEYKQVPTELLVYPGEPHGLTKMSNRKAKMEWDLAWFEKHVKGGAR